MNKAPESSGWCDPALMSLGLLLMKTLPDELQPVDDPRPPIGPGMRAVPHPELVRHLFFYQGDMQQAIAFGQKIIISAIDPIAHSLFNSSAVLSATILKGELA